MNVFYKTLGIALAMLTTFATNSMAERYHATLVQCRVGFTSEDTERLSYLGVTADSCEIWGAQKYSQNWAYFWCDIDGASFSIPQTSIKTNTEYTLEDISWNQKLYVRGLPSTLNQSYIVKVKSNKSGENKFISYTWGDNLSKSSWFVTGGKVIITSVTEPVYHADSNTFTQDVSWDYSNIAKPLREFARVYVSYDGGDFVETNSDTWEYEGKRTLTVTVPGDKKKVSYVVGVYSPSILQMVVKNGKWYSEPSEEYELKQPITTPDSGNSGGSNLDGDGQGTGVNNVSANAKLIDVYNVQGVRVAHNITLDQAASTLKRGVYVVNNKKVVLGK